MRHSTCRGLRLRYASTFWGPGHLSPAYELHVRPFTSIPEPPAPRWHADLVSRLGKCITFGCSSSQVQRAAEVLRVLASEWRTLTAGSEGFIAGGRRGLENQAVLWGEMDSFQHVNNVVYVRYAEASRVNWVMHFASVDPERCSRWQELMIPRDTGLIMKSIRADYKFPITYPDQVSVYHKLRSPPAPGDTSLLLDCVVLSHRHRRVAARTEENVVIYNYAAAKKTTIPPFVWEVLQDTWQKQRQEIIRARTRIVDLMGEVRRLEKETWDCEDAVEHMGSAGGGA